MSARQPMSEPIVREFEDGTFSFWAAYDTRRVVIYRVREDTTPLKRFKEKGEPGFEGGDTIAFRPATENEVELWLEEHTDYPCQSGVWVINKGSRYPSHNGYSGPTCRKAGVIPGRQYLSEATAQQDADKLSLHNPVGFVPVGIYRDGLIFAEYHEEYANHQYDGVDLGESSEE